MPSVAHQWLLLWLARKMARDGFLLGGYEGPTPQGGIWNALPPPFEIAGVRPDAWGIMPSTGRLAVGEAKTNEDLPSAHTQKQLRVFGRLLQRPQPALCRLYLAVPRSATCTLNRVLSRAGLLTREHVVCLYIPDCLLLEISNGHS
jgi:hypothetical protein